MGVHCGPASLECARLCDCEVCRACVAANELRPAVSYRGTPKRVGPPGPVTSPRRRLADTLKVLKAVARFLPHDDASAAGERGRA